MARKSRIKSASGIYHAILRGNNKQIIFEDEEDRAYFMNKLIYYRKKYGIKIYAYCLMDNHVHLLIGNGDIGISDLIKRLAGSYAYWFNRKYGRVGHLFQDRFRSEPVDNERYFLTVLRYIHSNPIKAGLVKSCEKYLYSSYMGYMKKSKWIDTQLCFSLINKKQFIEFHTAANRDECMDVTDSVFRFVTDREAIKYMQTILKDGIKQIGELSQKKRDELIRLLRRKGISISQISRLTGLSRGVICRQRLADALGEV